MCSLFGSSLMYFSESKTTSGSDCSLSLAIVAKKLDLFCFKLSRLKKFVLTNYLNLQTPYYTITYYTILLHNVNLCHIGYITNSFNTSLRQHCYIIQNGQRVSKETDLHTRPNSKTDATFRWSVFKNYQREKESHQMETDRTTDITREFGELIKNIQGQFQKFLENYRAQIISDYLDQQHENAVSVYTQTPVTDDGVQNSLLIAGRKAKLVRIKMENFQEDLAKVKSLQEGSCLTNYYRKCIEDMEKELHLDSLELDALETEMNMNGSSFEVNRVNNFYDEMDEESLHQPQENLPDHYLIWLGIQQKLQDEIQGKIQDDKERSKTESPEKDQEESPKADSAKRKKSPKKKSGIKTRTSSPKPGTSKKQQFEDISSDESHDLSRDRNDSNSDSVQKHFGDIQQHAKEIFQLK